KEGAYGTLMSTAFPGSAPAWSSFITGKNPGKHGIYYFTEHIPGSHQVRIVNASMRKGEAFWSLLGHSGKKVGIMNVPMTFPPVPVNGFFVSGMDAPGPESDFTYPASLKDELNEITGGYKIEVGVWGMISGGKPQLAIDSLKEMIRMRGKAARHLMKTRPWDLFTVVFTAPDRIQHFFWKYMDRNHPQYRENEGQKYGTAILEIYQTLDRELGRFLELIDRDTNLLILSDHGAGPNSNRSIYLNRWLASEGFLHYKTGKTERGNRLKTKIKLSLVAGLRRLSRRYLSRPLKEKILRLTPDLINWSISTMRFANIDWSRTRAYSEESVPWIWINLKGREPGGIVESGKDYEDIRNEISRALKKIRDRETGETIVDRVARREDLFNGPFLHKAPDLSIYFKDDKYISRPSHYSPDSDDYIRILSRDELDILEKDAKSSASHRSNGILFLCGPWIKNTGKLPTKEIIDIVPTVMYLLDEEIPDDYDGRVILESIKNEVASQKMVRHGRAKEETVRSVKEYDEEDEQKVSKRLKDLGYL
ncbi:MAG: alkaline phosphatase family protein, partial [Proteobacteria bacterium]|nr:alkaline phosphatase family protein [Pseudomonadota bacterium]